MGNRPGGELARRPLHFIWIADCSGSMSVDGKIQQLNLAIRDAIPHMREVASQNPNAQVLVRAIRFSNGATWHVSQPTPVENFTWQNLEAAGETYMGHALRLLAEQLKMPPMPDRALPPVLVLVSDGYPTDDFDAALSSVMAEPWGKKAVRVAIAIGEDADLEVLRKFIGNPEIPPLLAKNPDQLTRFIRWASTAVLKSASAPASQAGGGSASSNVPVPVLPSDPGPSSAGDIW